MEYNYPKFTPEMKKTHTILIPNMAITQFRLLEYALRYDGYKCEILGNCGSTCAKYSTCDGFATVSDCTRSIFGGISDCSCHSFCASSRSINSIFCHVFSTTCDIFYATGKRTNCARSYSACTPYSTRGKTCRGFATVSNCANSVFGSIGNL